MDIIENIVNKCKKISNQSIELVVIDYLQLISTFNKFDSKME